ncbi:hypothetical protein EJ02DRAFT_346029 [Clathrospora elynae]|uniref:Cupredoxin n=1 Tax=Clathrospora elynae TaxID=706981 RepID=A0A6A5SUL4_9PLEO|nr:hypothetical protein EJ02DRAFT_346029 [Clathrospora elynae]
MLFSTIFAATALAGATFAAEHVVAVSNKTGSLVFKPESLKAAEGDMVTFKFWPKNHSVAQAAFDSPCQPMNNGFWSGFVPTTSTEAVANWTFTYEVKNASVPIWFYCTQGMHCQNGMVGVINPPKSGPKTLEAFKNASKEATSNVSPTATAGSGGKLTQNMTGSMAGMPSPAATGAASQLTGSVAFASLTGLLTYFLL